MQIEVVAEYSGEWRLRVSLPPGPGANVTVVEDRMLNKRETAYDVTVDGRRPWRVIVLSMPNRRYVWRIEPGKYRKLGQGHEYVYERPHESLRSALLDGAVPGVVWAELRDQESKT